MERMERTRYRVAIVGLLVVIVSMMAGFAISAAVVDAGSGATNVCYNTKNGKIRAAVTACKAGKETARVLGGPNQVPSSFGSDVVSHALLDDTNPHDVAVVGVSQAGNYLVSGAVTLVNGDDEFAQVDCEARSSSGAGSGSQVSTMGGTTADYIANVPVTGRVSVPAGGSVSIRCTFVFGVTPNVGVVRAAVTAVRTA